MDDNPCACQTVAVQEKGKPAILYGKVGAAGTDGRYLYSTDGSMPLTQQPVGAYPKFLFYVTAEGNWATGSDFLGGWLASAPSSAFLPTVLSVGSEQAMCPTEVQVGWMGKSF